MPRIIVLSDVPGVDPQILMSERVQAANLESTHFRDQLAERLAWAVGDAHHVEQAQPRTLAPRGCNGAQYRAQHHGIAAERLFGAHERFVANAIVSPTTSN